MFRNLILSGLVVILRGADASADQLASKLWVSNYVAQVLSTNAPGGIAGAYVASWNGLTGAVAFAESDALALAQLGAHSNRVDNPHAVTPAQIGAATSAQLAALSNTVAAGADRIVTPDGTEFRDATGGVWRVYAPTNWYFAHNLPPVSTTLVSALSYPLPENANFTFDWGLGEEEPGTVDILTDLPAYDRYVTVTFPYSLSIMGNADPLTGFVLVDGASTATLYRAVGSALVTQRVDTVALVSVLPPAGVSAEAVTNIAQAAAAAATNGLGAATYTTATSSVIPVASAGTLFVNLTDWAATSSTWAASASWIVPPALTVTGRYEFAFSELSPGVYRGRQVWPACAACGWVPVAFSTLNQNYQATQIRYLTMIGAASSNAFTLASHPFQDQYSILRFGYICAAASNPDLTFWGSQDTIILPTPSYYVSKSAATATGAGATITLGFPATNLATMVSYYIKATTSSFPGGNVSVHSPIARPMNELERAAYAAGWRP